MEKEIEIDGKTYVIDINRAIEQKLLYPKLKNHDLQYGDVFQSSTHKSYMVIIPFGWSITGRYYYTGLDGKIMQPFSSLIQRHCENGLSKEEMLDYIQQRRYEFVANINFKIEDVLKLVKQ